MVILVWIPSLVLKVTAPLKKDETFNVKKEKVVVSLWVLTHQGAVSLDNYIIDLLVIEPI